MNTKEKKNNKGGKKQQQQSSSPFDSPTRFAGSAVKGFNPGGAHYPVPSYSPAKPIAIKKRPDVSSSSLVSSCPAAVPPPKVQEKSSPPTLPHEKIFTNEPPSFSTSLSFSTKKQTAPIAPPPGLMREDMRSKSQLLLSAIKGNSGEVGNVEDTHALRKVVNQEKSVELMKLLNIKPSN